MFVIKRDGKSEEFLPSKIYNAIESAFRACNLPMDVSVYDTAMADIKDYLNDYKSNSIEVETVQDIIETAFVTCKMMNVGNKFAKYRKHRSDIRDIVKKKEDFIRKYAESFNTADATIDDNSNVASKNIAILNTEIHKDDNIEVNRSMIMKKLGELFPINPKQYIKDLESHIIYKHDESAFTGAVAPYCCSISMYPFLCNGIRDLGGLSAAPKKLDSFCGMYVNLIFATSSQFAGAVATPEFLLYFDYFARGEWGDLYYKNANKHSLHFDRFGTDGVQTTYGYTIRKKIHQYFQQVIYSINQPAAARGMQAAFVNFSYFDKYFFESVFSDFVFPDGTRPVWESLEWLQWEFIEWFAEERNKCMMTFPVESFAFLAKDGKFADEKNAKRLAKVMAKGHCPFIYISDTVDSLSSCCRLKNMLTTKEFSFTNGNIGVMTGSKSVMTLNLNRILHNFKGDYIPGDNDFEGFMKDFLFYLSQIMDRVYKYQISYNELLKDVEKAHLLSVYDAGLISLNKQYLTIGLNGLNEAAESIGLKCTDNEKYKSFCTKIFSHLKDLNKSYSKLYNVMFNTEMVPAESLGIKNYNWDKSDSIQVGEDHNLYGSYIYRTDDQNLSVLDKLKMHGSEYIGEYLDGGSAAHINLEEHLDENQYFTLLEYALKVGCQYFTFNVPYNVCRKCGSSIKKAHVDNCPCCGSDEIDTYTRIIGYLTKVSKWSKGRREEYNSRYFENLSSHVKGKLEGPGLILE